MAPFCDFIILCEVLAGFLVWQEVPALASCLGSAATGVDRDLSAPPPLRRSTPSEETPLAVTASAALVFRERVSISTLGGRAHGLSWGAALTVAPPSGKPLGWRLLRADRVAVYDHSDLTTRGLASDIPSIFLAAAIGTAGFAVAAFHEPWRWPSERAWVWLRLAPAACSSPPPSWASPCAGGGFGGGRVRYVPVPLSILLVSILLGGWWWNEVPDRIACLGLVLVLAAGLYVRNRERLSLTSTTTNR